MTNCCRTYGADTLRLGSSALVRTGSGPGGCTLAKATFVPPPPELVQTAFDDLETFLNHENDLPRCSGLGLLMSNSKPFTRSLTATEGSLEFPPHIVTTRPVTNVLNLASLSGE